jgi:hydroxyacylglutathione hydrolase
MFFKRFYDDMLAQASYMIGCQRTGEALVVDPNRDAAQYIAAADAEQLRITHVTETHIHADFVSGARELAGLTGAQLLLSREGGADWQYAYAADAKARLLSDGDTFTVGNIRIEVMHTPGHTPEHISFVVTDRPASGAPWGILTGDFVFVGDVGRPDLLERAAGYQNTMESSARALFRSLARFRALPDHMQVWPGHGAGSACGKALGAVASSTVGYERLANWALITTDEDEFIRLVLEGQPEPPSYFARMKRVNKMGPATICDATGGLPRPDRIDPAAFEQAQKRGEIVIDTRDAASFAAGFLPGTLNIPLDRLFATWAGWLIPYDRDVWLIAGDADRANRAAHALALIGLDRVAGYVDAGIFERRELSRVQQAGAHDVALMLEQGAVDVIDVRWRAEYDASHLPGVVNIPVALLRERIAELASERPIVVQCQAGARSAIAASVLLAHGVHRVINLDGGIAAWQRAGLPVTEAA